MCLEYGYMIGRKGEEASEKGREGKGRDLEDQDY